VIAMAKVYIKPEQVKKYAKITAGVSIPLVFLMFFFLQSKGDIQITGYSGDSICEGTLSDPCYAYINFTAKKDIYIYPISKQDQVWIFNTTPTLKDLILQKKVGDNWQTINLAKPMNSKVKYSIKFDSGKSYELKFIGYKKNSYQRVKWSFGDVDPWWDSGWKQKQNVTITNTNNALNLYNYQVAVNVTFDSNMQADFDDLRFVDDDETTVLDYWIEQQKASSWAFVWVEVPLITGGATKDIEMYYGNSSVSTTANGNNTFILFDDFTAAINTTTWKELSNFCDSTITAGKLNLTCGAGRADNYVTIVNTTAQYTYNISVSFNASISDTVHQHFGFGYTNFTTSCAAVAWCYPPDGGFISGDDGTTDSLRTYKAGTATTSAFSSPTVSSYKIYSISRNISAMRYDVNHIINQTHTSNIPILAKPFSFMRKTEVSEGQNGAAITTYVDWVFIRNFSAPEPSISFKSEELAPVPQITLEHPINQTYDTDSIWANVSLDRTGSWCGYSMNNTANITMTNVSGNWNKLMTVPQGSHNISFCCNDTYGMNCSFNTAATIMVWFVDSITPTVLVTTPENNSDVLYGENGWKEFNMTFSETLNWGGYSINDSANVTTGSVKEKNVSYDWGVGDWNITITFNDSAGNTNQTYLEFSVIPAGSNCTLYSNGTDGDRTYQINQTFNVTVMVNNSQGTDALHLDSNYTDWVLLDGDSPSLENTTISLYNGTWNFTGWYDATENYSACTPRIHYLTIISNRAPQFSEIKEFPTDPHDWVASDSYQFNVTITDLDGNSEVNVTYIEFNDTTGTLTNLKNFTLSNRSTEWYKSFSYLPAGVYLYRFWANDTGNLWNFTDQYTYTINRISRTADVTFLNGGLGTYPFSETADCSISAGSTDGTLTLTRNSSSQTRGTSIQYPAGGWNMTCLIKSGQNYTDASMEEYMNISKRTLQMSLLGITNGTYPISRTIYWTANDVSGNVLDKLITRNASDISAENNTAVSLAAGLWNYTWFSPGNQNYTTNITQIWFNIDRSTSTCSISNSPSGTFDYGNLETAECTGTYGDLTGVNLYRNGLQRNNENASALYLPAGTHNYVCNRTVTENYTTCTSSSSITINRISPSLAIAPLTSVNYQTSTQIGCQRVTGDISATLTLYRNTTQVATGTTVTINETAIVLGAATYNYTCSYSQSENYTELWSLNQYRIVNRIAPTLVFTHDSSIASSYSSTYPNQTNIQSSEANSVDTDCTYVLARNGSSISNGAQNIQAAVWNFTYNTSGCTNFTSAHSEFIFTLGQNQSTSSYYWLTIDNANADKTITYPNTANATGNYSSGVFNTQTIIFTLYRNFTSIGTQTGVNDTTQLSGLSVYNYTYNTSGNVNYTSSEKTLLLTVSQNITNPVTAWLNGTAFNNNGTYGLTVNASILATYGDLAGSLFIYRNGTQKKTGSGYINYTETSPGGYWEWKMNLTGTVNYTSNSTGFTYTFNISQASSSARLEFNGSTSNSEYHKDQVINITGLCGNTVQNASLTGNHSLFGTNFTQDIDGVATNISDIGLIWFPSNDNINISVTCLADVNFTSSQDWSILNISADLNMSKGTNITLSFRTSTRNASLVQPLGQNSTNGAVCFNNTRSTMTSTGLNVSLFTNVNTSKTYNIELWASATSNYSAATKLGNETSDYWWGLTNLTFNNKTCIWLWANFNSTFVGVWTPKLYSDTKRFR
jgi:hypothetical protein